MYREKKKKVRNLIVLTKNVPQRERKIILISNFRKKDTVPLNACFNLKAE